MDQQTLIVLMTIFVGLAAIAMLMQAAMLIGIYRVSKQTQEKLFVLLPRIESLVESTREGVDQSRKQILEITTRANAILESARVQLAKVEEVVTDGTSRARAQMDRMELVLDNTMTRAQETVAAVHESVMWPVRELHGISAGIRAALNFLAHGRRPSVAQATSDEEMFI
jgi:hypothetical protein